VIDNEFHDMIFFQDTIRTKMKPWYEDSRKHHNCKCVITSQKSVTIHHITPLKTITLEALEILNLPVKNGNDYTLNERKSIFDKCLELHYKHGFGACMIPKLHMLLHSEYGKETSKSDYEAFVSKYKELIKTGEYEIIKTHCRNKAYKVKVEIMMAADLKAQATKVAESQSRTLGNLIEYLLKQEIEKAAK
jgi:hypothetical protein